MIASLFLKLDARWVCFHKNIFPEKRRNSVGQRKCLKFIFWCQNLEVGWGTQVCFWKRYINIKKEKRKILSTLHSKC